MYEWVMPMDLPPTRKLSKFFAAIGCASTTVHYE